MRQLLMTFLVMALGTPAAAQDLIQRFLLREDQPVTQYSAFRRLEARNERFNAEGWLEACVVLEAQRQWSFRVIREGGNGYIRKNVLRKALESEREAIARGEPARAALSLDNYVIAAEAPDAGRLGEAALLLVPRRQDVLLVSGRVVVTDPEADLLRIEGRLSKAPSFWTRSVEVVRRYARRAGVRVPIDMVSTAEVRVAGRSQFHVSYDYLSINGVLVNQSPGTSRSPCLVTQN